MYPTCGFFSCKCFNRQVTRCKRAPEGEVSVVKDQLINIGPVQVNHTFNNNNTSVNEFSLNGYQGNSSNQGGVSTVNEGSNTTIGPNINTSSVMNGGSGGFVNNTTSNGGEAVDGEDDTTVIPNENLEENIRIFNE